MMQSVITSSMGQEFLTLPQARSGHSGVGLASTVRGVSSPWFTIREAAVLANMHAHPVMHKVPGRAIGPNKGFCSLRSVRARWAYEAGLSAVSYRNAQRPVHIQKQILSSLYISLGRSRQWLCSSPGQAAPPCGTFAVATLAQEGHSSLEGVTEEELRLPEQQAEALSPLEEDTSGPVIIRVRECSDGSVIFDFGEAAQRPDQDPLAAFVRGAAAAEESQAETSEAAAPLLEQDSQVADERPGELVESDESSRGISTSSESSGSAEVSVPSLRLNAGGAQLPHPAKVKKGGEDAFFCAQSGQTSYIGVSDGVGGWATLGIDAGLYSRELMYHCQRLVSEAILPKSMLIRAHKATKATGSATAMVARLQGNRLRVANLGDSGFLLVRDGQVAMASTQMQHAFNFPFQVGSKGGDDPDVAKDYELEVERGDLLIMGTDGLFDNVFEKEIAEAGLLLRSKGATPQYASQQIAAFAQQRSFLKTGLSPFAVQADASGYKHMGGKPDDITVVVAYVE